MNTQPFIQTGLKFVNELSGCGFEAHCNEGFIGVIYRSQSQDAIEFSVNFLSNFETILSDTTTNNGLFTIILGDFNARSLVWWTKWQSHNWKHETWIPYDNCAWVSSTHITTHSSNATIFFFNWLNIHWSTKLTVVSIHPYILIAILRLHMYCKFILNIKYPPPYKHLAWNYKKANVESIKNIESVNWKLMFINKSVPKQVSIFNETLMNIFSNFTTNKLVTFDDRDPPPPMDEQFC